MTQTAIATPRGTAEIPLESAHKFTSTCLSREQFPSFQRKVVAGFFLFPGFCASLPRGKEAEIPVCIQPDIPRTFFFSFPGGRCSTERCFCSRPITRGIWAPVPLRYREEDERGRALLKHKPWPGFRKALKQMLKPSPSLSRDVFVTGAPSNTDTGPVCRAVGGNRVPRQSWRNCNFPPFPKAFGC